jgi:hypothetical protein
MNDNLELKLFNQYSNILNIFEKTSMNMILKYLRKVLEHMVTTTD